jgi:hypothetical protein
LTKMSKTYFREKIVSPNGAGKTGYLYIEDEN